MELKIVKIDVPKDCNVILGQSHFIKTVEDIHEALVSTVPDIKFGLGFCESSGPALVRHTGNDEELRKLAADKAFELACGHCFLLFIRNAYPINVLQRIKDVHEVVNIFAATANPLEVIVVESEQGRGILGVIDGMKTQGVESDKEIKERYELLRKFGYKL